MIYKIVYVIMLLSFGFLSCTGPTLKDKVLGGLLTAANALIFWR